MRLLVRCCVSDWSVLFELSYIKLIVELDTFSTYLSFLCKLFYWTGSAYSLSENVLLIEKFSFEDQNHLLLVNGEYYLVRFSYGLHFSLTWMKVTGCFLNTSLPHRRCLSSPKVPSNLFYSTLQHEQYLSGAALMMVRNMYLTIQVLI